MSDVASNRIVFTVKLGELAEIPGTPFAYWAPASLRELFQKYPPLDRDVARMPDKPKIADVKVGLQTSDDLRFTRFWWEVPAEEIAASREETLQGKKWVPFAKGGRSFYHDIQLVVNWANDGEEIKNFREPGGRLRSRPQNESFYFRPGLAWADVGSSPRLDMWRLPSGSIFSCESAHAVFPASQSHTWQINAFGVAELSALLFWILDPLEHGRSVGTVAKLPVSPAILSSVELAFFAREAHDLLREWATGDETATVFIAPWILQAWWRQKGRSDAELLPVTGHPLARDFAWSEWEGARRVRQVLWEAWGDGVLRPLAEACARWEEALRRRLEQIQSEINEEVYRLYGIGEEDRALIEAELGRPAEGDQEADGKEEEPEDKEGAAPEALVTRDEHVRRLVHYLVHEAVKEDPDGIVPLRDTYTAAGELERGLAFRVRAKLAELFGETAMPTVERELREALGKTLDEWLATDFFGYHTGLYRLRPIIWHIASRPRGVPAFGCFVYWHKLDADTLRKVREVYLRPVLEGAQREAERLAAQYAEKRATGAPVRELREAERAWRQAEERVGELRDLSERIQNLLQPHRLSLTSRSAWVAEKVNEITAHGCRPNRDYGVRVNIEPLKQAGVLPVDAARVKG
ncbi:MAG: hypothetical protein GX492_10695 [Firmicutes bacterium]|nr:hypothetical protein [Bacillota bacterium]